MCCIFYPCILNHYNGVNPLVPNNVVCEVPVLTDKASIFPFQPSGTIILNTNISFS